MSLPGGLQLLFYHRDSETISILIVHCQRERDQAWVAGNTLIVFDNTCIPFILRRAKPLAATDTIVRDNDAAGPCQAQRPFEILWVGRLVGINKDEIEWRLTL